MAIIGIDLGTTNSLACIWQEGGCHLIPNALGEVLTPSAVSLDEDGTLLVGRAARERLVSHPQVTAASFKRFMGTERQFKLGRRSFTAPELSALVLRKLRDDAEKWLGRPVDEAVISVPAYFNDGQRAATKLAASLSGLHVERLVNEPSAAALACRLDGQGGDGCFLVFDLGGGTLDVSVVDCFENIVEIISVAGSNRLGGDDFDRIIAQAFCRENGLDMDLLAPEQQAIVLAGAIQCKLALGRGPRSAMMIDLPGLQGSLSMTNQTLAELSAELLDRIRAVVERAVRDCGRTPGDIDQVVLVGGSCHMPLVQRYVTHLLGRPLARVPSPDTTVALGAGIYAGIKGRAGEVRDVLLTDICPFSLGTDTFNHQNPDRSLFYPILERNSTLPSSRVERFCTVGDRQKRIAITIYQGEALYAGENTLLDTLEIEVPPAPAGQEAVDVRFAYDINGLLEVEVTSVSTGKRVEKTLVSKSLAMSPQELAQRRQELARLKTDPADGEENRLVLARAQRLFAEVTGPRREALREQLARFQRALMENRQIALQRERAEFSAFLDELEAGLFLLEPGGGQA